MGRYKILCGTAVDVEKRMNVLMKYDLTFVSMCSLPPDKEGRDRVSVMVFLKKKTDETDENK